MHMPHVLARELSELADRIEQEFFRIERENRWAASVINGLIAGAAVGIVAWVASHIGPGRGDLLLFACLGSSSASMVFAPVARPNSLRSILLAYLVAAAVCVLLFPLRGMPFSSVALLCFLAVAVSISLMRLFDVMHPAAVGAAMAFVIYDRPLQSMFLLLLAIIVLLIVVKILAYTYHEELTFRQFHREFRSSYYGKEVVLTVEEPPTPDETEAKHEGGPPAIDEQARR